MPASDLTPLSFYRNYVARNKPVIVTGAIDAWPALHKWTFQYMADKMGAAKVCSLEWQEFYVPGPRHLRHSPQCA